MFSVKRYVVKLLALVVAVGFFAGADAGETYYNVKYQLPGGISSGWGGFVLGAGINRDDGIFIGLDLNLLGTTGLGYWGGEDAIFEDDEKSNSVELHGGKDKPLGCFYGGGLSVGKTHKFSNGIELVSGSSVGYWYSGNHYGIGATSVTDKKDANYTYVSKHSFLAPVIVKTRWKFLEFSYKMFVGTMKTTQQINGTRNEGEGDFGVTNHEMSVGFYLAK